MGVLPIPSCDLATLRRRLYDECAIEIPLTAWDGQRFVRLSVQGYSTRSDVEYRDYYLDSSVYSERYAVKMRDGRLPGWSWWAGGPQTLLCAKKMLPLRQRNYAQLRGRGVRLTASYLDVFSIDALGECYDAQHPTTR